MDNYLFTSVPMVIRLKLFFAQSFLSISSAFYGAVSDLCEEYKACHVRTERPVLAGQSDPLFEPASLLMTTPTPSTDDLAQEDLLQKYQERVERLSQQNRVIKICTDAGFLTTVDVGQWITTKDTEEFSQFTESVACREYTLPRDEKISDSKGSIRGNTKIGPVLEVITSYLQGKYGVEIRIESVNKDNSHSWVRISHGLKKLVKDLSNKEIGAIEFWRFKDYLRNEFEYSHHWSDEMWKSKMAGNKKRFQYCTDPSGQEIRYLRALQGHSGRNPIDPSLQDNV